MSSIGTYVIFLIMVFVVLGAIAAVRDPQTGMGKEFVEGLHSIGPIFIPVAGIMASIPYLSKIVESLFGPVFAWVGADPAIAATTFIASDMGGYSLAHALARTPESWTMALITGFMAGSTIIFSIPVGLAMLDKKDHPYMALGVMSGILSIPLGVMFSYLVISITDPQIRDVVSSDAAASYTLALTASTILSNLVPLAAFCVVLALGLRLIPDLMISAFLWFGRIMYAAITLVLAFSIVEYFTGVFTHVLGHWGLEPIIADKNDQFRALEVAGYIGVMLCGAFPMVYVIRSYLARPMQVIGAKLGLEPTGAAGLLATTANILAMFRLVGEMRPKDKVLCIAYAVCAAFMLGDHLAFSANFQPTLIAPVMAGKIFGGICGFVIARWLSVPKAVAMGKDQAIAHEPSQLAQTN